MGCVHGWLDWRRNGWTVWWLTCTHLLHGMMFNSSSPSAAYMCQRIGWALVQIMACCLFSAMPLSKPMLAYCQLDPKNKLQWNFNQNSTIFIQENTFENVVCKMVTICSGRDEFNSWGTASNCIPPGDTHKYTCIDSYWAIVNSDGSGHESINFLITLVIAKQLFKIWVVFYTFVKNMHSCHISKLYSLVQNQIW